MTSNRSMPPSDTSFLQALAVPQLAQACIRILNTSHPDQPGSGLKTLRIISWDARKILMPAVHGYTLELGGDDQSKYIEMMKSVHFHKQTRLQCLRLTPSPPTPGPQEFPWVDHYIECSAAASQFLYFLREMGPTLSSVTRLELTLGNAFTSQTLEIAAANKWWDPLAQALPQLRQLCVHGKLDKRQLSDLGGFGLHLTSLEVHVMDLPPAAILHLQSLLPYLTSLTLLPGIRCPVSRDDDVLETQLKTVKILLRSCPGLLCFNSGPYPLTRGMWRNLPPGLQQLRSFSDCSIEDRPLLHVGIESQIGSPTPLRLMPQHGSLRQLHVVMRGAIWLHNVTDFLQSAPKLQHLDLDFEAPSLHVMYSPTQPKYLSCLAERLAAGLELTIAPHSSSDSGGGSGESGAESRSLVVHAGVFRPAHFIEEVPKYQEREGPGIGEVTLGEFLACLPPLPNITNVDLRGEGCPKAGLCLSHAVRIFPNLQDLTLNDMRLQEHDLLILTACKTLRRLTLQHVAWLEADKIGAMCERMPSLQLLRILECEDFWVDTEGAELVALLAGKAAAVKVEVVDEYVEGESEEFQDPSDSDEWEETERKEQEKL